VLTETDARHESGLLLLAVENLRRLGVTASFTLRDGECMAVRGPSGSGKTLLLRAIADLDPNDGTVRLDGILRESVPAPLWRRWITYVAAEPGWWADRVAEHFADWPETAPLVAELGLPAGVADWSVQRLSTGERQRLGLARALALNSRVLLLDEPTSGLDPDSVRAVEAVIAARRAAGTSLLWVTHDASQARRVASRLLVIRDGHAEEVRP
jgi:phosphate-transporting ATPase